MPGAGASSPVMFDGKMFLTCFTMPGQGTDSDSPESSTGEDGVMQRHVLCLDPRGGEILWSTPLPSTHDPGALEGFVALHGFASSTPVVDETGVYVFFGTTGAAAFNHDGSHRWTTHLGDKTHAFGTANSPVLHGDTVIINASVECGALVALNKTDGSEVWRAENINRSWNTPLLYRALDGNQELTLSVQGKVIAFDPATGEQVWEAGAIDDYICPSVIEHEGVIYAVGGRASKLIAIQSGGRGDVTESHVLWALDRGSNVSSPVFHEGHLYWANESQGIVYCADTKSGTLVYEERLDPKPDRIYASPLVAAGMVYYVSRDSGVYVVAASPSFRLIAHNKIATDESIFNASPITVGERLILRSDQYVYAIGE